MNSDVESHIRQNHPWSKLPANVKQILGNSQKEYEKTVVQFSVNNQLRFKTNLVKTVKKEERRYYEELLQYSQEHLMLYPYHLADVVVKGLRVTPFVYYVNMMSDIMTQEKSYDSLPNFTAADCLRLMGIGRNQYIDLMNQSRSSKKFFRRKPPKDLLPTKPIETVMIESWWVVNIGYITEDDMKSCSQPEKDIVDKIIDVGPQIAGELSYKIVHNLYRKGLVYLDVPINDDDCIIVPPLENFVMNRVLGDYFETLLYKIFVSIDEHTSVSELSNVLQIDLQLVKMAVSMYCRLGFAKKKGSDSNEDELHPSWKDNKTSSKKVTQDQLIIDWGEELVDVNELPIAAPVSKTPEVSDLVDLDTPMDSSQGGAVKRIAFLFDSTLTAFLMMGNLSPGLKTHAVTMFEVGKLSDESLDSFLSELEKVGYEAEGEARRYFVHAITLRDTVRFLRYNKTLCADMETGSSVDLIRCESLLSLDPSTRARVLNKNYSLLVSMAPLSYEIQPVSSCTPQHLGPAIPEVNSVWFKLYMYNLTGCGPASLLLVKGTKLRRLPQIFLEYDRLLVTTWGHDPGVIATSNILLTLNDALSHSAVFVQAHGWQSEGKTVHVPFPLDKGSGSFAKKNFSNHSAIHKLSQNIDMTHLCGYVTLLNTGRESKTIWKHEEDEEEELNINMNCSRPAGSVTGSIHSSDSSTVLMDEPINGLKDKKSADMLATEIDLLDIDGSDSASLLENKDSPDSNLALMVEDLLVEEEWCLLDCYFGIPLFEPSINKDVCDRIMTEGLFNSKSLQELLQSSRQLSLRLLDFISQFQDVLPGTELLDHQTTNKDQSVTYPTQCLIFTNNVLRKWDGH